MTASATATTTMTETYIGPPVLDVYIGENKNGGGSSTNSHPSATPGSRTYIYIWALSTWVMYIVFSILLINVFTTDIVDYTGGPTYRRSDFFPKNMGVWYKERWSDWSTLKTTYTTPGASVVSTMAAGTGSTTILDAVMKLLMCHGDVSTGTLPGPLQGGVSTVTTGSDTILSPSFQFASEMCQCVYQQHKDVYANMSKTAITAELVDKLGNEFVNGEAAALAFGVPKGQDLLRKCFFPTRPSYKIMVDKQSFLDVSPYMLIMNINAIAGMVAAMYLISAPGYQTNHGNSLKAIISNITGRWAVGLVLGAMNLALGITCLVFSNPSTGSLWFWLSMDIVIFLIMAFLIVFTMADFTEGSKYHKYRTVLHTNIRVIQRVGFWVQYFCVAPAIVLLYDVMTHQRATSYITSRFLFTVGLVFMGAATDMLTLFNEQLALSEFSKTSLDNLRASMWWSWCAWTAAAATFAYSSGTVVTLPFGVTDTMQGGTLFVELAFMVYIIGIPLVSIPGIAEMHQSSMKWARDTSAAALGLRLAVDLLARFLLTVSAIFWLTKPVM